MLAPPRARDPRLKGPSLAGIAALLLGAMGVLGLVGCAGGPRPSLAPSSARAAKATAASAHAVSSSASTVSPASPAAPVSSPEVDAEVAARLKAGVEYGPWQSLGGWARYMAPVDRGGGKRFVDADGGADVAFQFHGAEVAEKDWRQSGLNALIISVTFPGWGSSVYKEGFADPVHFGEILDEALKHVGATHVRRLLLVSWSAGYAAMGLALSNDHYYALADAIVVLDGLHADYIDGLPDEHPIAIFERFARDAIAGKKTMVVAHSAIVPPGYASTTEMAAFLLAKLGVPRVEQQWTNASGMVGWYRADSGDLHVRGFRGNGPRDHLDQLHLLDELVREHVAPRWTRLQVEEARRGGATTATTAAGN